MKVHGIHLFLFDGSRTWHPHFGGPKVEPLGNRLYKLSEFTRVIVQTDEGKFVFEFKPGFITNFRSGGVLVDSFVDQIGNGNTQLAYLCHDAIYTPCASCGGEHPVSRKLGDQILKAMLLYAGMGKFKASVVYSSVRAFGSGAYDEDDALTASNSKAFNFTWTP